MNMKKSLKTSSYKAMSVIAVWFMLALSVLAQNAGQITGVVKDPTLSVVPGSQVTVTNQQTSAMSTVLTDGQGAYTFPSLLPGTYLLRAEFKGFQAGVSPALKVDAGQTIKFDLTLTIAGTTQSVDVTAGTVENAYRVDAVAVGGPLG